VRAGFIGLGDQGLPMARRIAEAGVPTTVWARRAEVAEAASEWGAEIAGSPAALGKASDVVGVCVFDAAGVEEVLFGPDGVVEGLAPGGVVTIHSTVSPAEIRAVAERASRSGISVLDAPVSGGGRAAAAGELLVMLAGPDEACDRAVPVLETYSRRVVRLGAVGTAQLAKLLNNTLLAAQIGLVDDALRIGEQHGLGPGLAEVLRTGSARGFAVDLLAGIGSVGALAKSQFGPTIAKDVRLLADTAGPAVPPALLIDVAEDLLGRMAAAGRPSDDAHDQQPDTKGVTQP
jgi:3-hydroxyisobutyrate dehydrogenase